MPPSRLCKYIVLRVDRRIKVTVLPQPPLRLQVKAGWRGAVGLAGLVLILSRVLAEALARGVGLALRDTALQILALFGGRRSDDKDEILAAVEATFPTPAVPAPA